MLVTPVFCFAQEGETDPWGREVTTDCRPPSNMFLKAIQENLEMQGIQEEHHLPKRQVSMWFSFFLLAGFLELRTRIVHMFQCSMGSDVNCYI